ncbi:hypothetical protein AB9K26_13490 [Psychroserpens sp. XS_ASV72]|uniref:hypothetical protein n=1 Tax=Psychroserpens sp. XS_ASV72 TaxID=3241293 RepID=UPI0035150606
MKQKIVTFIIFLLFYIDTNAQCAMCRAVLESEEGQSAAKGVNDGIMYLMVIPYLLVGSVGFLIYWNFFRKKKAEN